MEKSVQLHTVSLYLPKSHWKLVWVRLDCTPRKKNVSVLLRNRIHFMQTVASHKENCS